MSRMSLYSFFPMKKRKVCKTPNGSTRRNSSTLGKLKKASSVAPSADENAIEILWDNNSPSPTTTIALAGKRLRGGHKTKAKESVTDVSFVVQKLSEITSPVVHQHHPALLEMWVNKDVCERKNSLLSEEEFTSPPFRQTRCTATSSPLSTPSIPRRTSKRHSRHATRQFMLEIQKLVDEIQKNELSSSSQDKNETVACKDRLLEKRAKINDECLTVTQSLTNAGQQLSSKKHAISVPGTIVSEILMDDSYEWTEDDMDELILTCQLSSSGKGSLTIPDPPRPQCGMSPSQVVFVPETQLTQLQSQTTCAKTEVEPQRQACFQATQILFDEEKPTLNTNKVVQSQCVQKVPERKEADDWEFDSDDVDALLASAVQEFESSQEPIAKPRCTLNEKNNDQKIYCGFSHDGDDDDCRNLRETLNVARGKSSPRKKNHNKQNSNSTFCFKEPLETSLPMNRNSSKLAKDSFACRPLNNDPTTCSNSDCFPGRGPNSSSSINSGKGTMEASFTDTSFSRQQATKAEPTNSNQKSVQYKENSTTQISVNKKAVGFLSGNMSREQSIHASINCNSERDTDDQILGNEKTVGDSNVFLPQERFIKMQPTNSNSNNVLHPGRQTICSKETAWSSLCNTSTQRDTSRSKLMLKRKTPCGNTSAPSSENIKLGNTNLIKSKDGCSKHLTSKCNSFKESGIKDDSKSGVFIVSHVRESECNAKEGVPDTLQNEDQGKEFSHFLDGFIFDEFLTEVIKPTSTRATNIVPKPSNEPTPKPSTIGLKKYSKEEIERKRLEARRRLSKTKQKNQHK